MTDKKPESQKSWEEEVWGSQTLMERTDLRHATLLHCWCPHCGAELNQGDRAVFEIVNRLGEVGTSKVAAYLNVFEQETTVFVEEDEELADVRCPHCHTSLILSDRQCPEDGSKVADIRVSVADSKKMGLVVCVRRSCRWYEISDEDEQQIILRDSHEW